METTVSIPGMHCASCASLIKDVSSEFSPIKNIEVDVNAKTVRMEHSDDFDLSKWTQEIESLGDTYKVHPISA